MATESCKFWLPRKKRFCANIRHRDSQFCGNHTQRSDAQWIPCPIDSSHSVLEENLESHLKRCPFLKQAQSLSAQPFYQQGINAGSENDDGDVSEVVEVEGSASKDAVFTSEMKRNAVYAMSVPGFLDLIGKIKSAHASVRNCIRDSHKDPEACSIWTNGEVDKKIPYQEKHVLQQASILGNMEDFGVIKRSWAASQSSNGQCGSNGESETGSDVPAVVEFGAGRGYLTQMLADCYGIKKVILVERNSYKLKADRSLRQKESLVLERLRIDNNLLRRIVHVAGKIGHGGDIVTVEDLNLNAVESLQGGAYLAIGKHLCGPATDMTLRCCIRRQSDQDSAARIEASCHLRGLAIATCCHHLCQWKTYINKKYMSDMGFSKEDFHKISWFTSWAVDADHSSDFPAPDSSAQLELITENKELSLDTDARGVDEIVRNMQPIDRAVLGFMCKDIIDAGRFMWMKSQGLTSELVKYVPVAISPENHLLIASSPSVAL